MKLGEFSIRVYHTVSSRKDNVTFILLRDGRQRRTSKTFEHLYAIRKNKVRDQVIVATRLVPIDDYDDPELKKFRRRILLRLRRVAARAADRRALFQRLLAVVRVDLTVGDRIACYHAGRCRQPSRLRQPARPHLLCSGGVKL